MSDIVLSAEGDPRIGTRAVDVPVPSGVTNIVVLIPVYDDWESVRLLLPPLDAALTASGVQARLILLDDGSRCACPASLVSGGLQSVDRVDVLTLRRNLGHQRALCIGIAAVVANPALKEGALVIMDADGQDSPADVERLLRQWRASSGSAVVFGKRIRRSEGAVFRIFYLLFRLAHRVMTGVPVQIGNFSVLPVSLARKLVVSSELWNHYAASAIRARLPLELVDAPRGTRLQGESRMNFVGLVSHGMSAMSVFGDRIGVRSLVASIALMGVLALGIGAVVAVRFLTPLAVPGWATLAAGLITLLLMQTILLSVLFAFLVHLGRAGGGFLPARDYGWYVESIDPIWTAND